MTTLQSPLSRTWNRIGFVRLRREGAIAPIITAAAFLAIYIIINPSLLTRFQLQTAANLVAPLAIISLGQLLVVLVGGIDISIGAVTSLANVVFATQVVSLPLPVAMLLAVAAGLACGLFNGVLVAYAKLPAIAVTLASSFIIGSIANEILDRAGGKIPQAFYLATSGEILPFLPAALVWIVLIGVLLWLILHRTALGRHIYGVGSSRDSVQAAGLNARAAQLAAFAISGVLVSFGAMMLAGSTLTGDPRSGDPYLLNSIAVVALAGASFVGGRGSIVATIVGAVILALIGNLLFFARVNSYWQYVISALIIFAVVGAPVLWRRLYDRVRGAHRG